MTLWESAFFKDLTNNSQESAMIINQTADSFNRLDYARKHQGWTAFEGDRNYNKVLGYPEEIDISDYYSRYKRQSIAGRIVDLPAIDTWAKPPKVSEDDNIETPFVKDWQTLVKKKHVWSVLCRADKLSGIGRFGILLIGTRGDGGLETSLEQDALKSPDDILYLRPFSELVVTVKDIDGEPGSERSGLPVIYNVQLDGSTTTETEVHYTRIVHLADGKLDNGVYGTPRLEGVWNDLLDMVKFVGGTAEATWLNMRSPLALGPKAGYRIEDTDAAKKDLLQETKRFQHDILRIMYLNGFEPMPMGQGIVMDPEPPFAVTLSLISGKTGIPQRKLVGSAQGELSSAREDTRQWAGTVAARQQTYAEPEILRPFIDWCIWSGAIKPPTSGEYDVGTLKPGDDDEREWPSIVEQTDDERADTAVKNANAAKSLAGPGGQVPLNDDEKRAMLGLPPRDREPDAEAETVGEMAAQIAANVLVGKTSLQEFVTWMMDTIEDYNIVTDENGAIEEYAADEKA